jgi:hypothetical protein
LIKFPLIIFAQYSFDPFPLVLKMMFGLSKFFGKILGKAKFNFYNDGMLYWTKFLFINLNKKFIGLRANSSCQNLEPIRLNLVFYQNLVKFNFLSKFWSSKAKL